MPFTDEVDKVAKATEAVTFWWKIWGMAVVCIGAVVLLLSIFLKFCR